MQCLFDELILRHYIDGCNCILPVLNSGKQESVAIETYRCYSAAGKLHAHRNIGIEYLIRTIRADSNLGAKTERISAFSWCRWDKSITGSGVPGRNFRCSACADRRNRWS